MGLVVLTLAESSAYLQAIEDFERALDALALNARALDAVCSASGVHRPASLDGALALVDGREPKGQH